MAHPGAPRGRRHVNAGPRATSSPAGRVRTVTVLSEPQRDKLDQLAATLGIDRNAVVGRLIELDKVELTLDVDETYQALSA